MSLDRRQVIALMLAACSLARPVYAQNKILIAAASDLSFALPKLLQAFQTALPEYKQSEFLVTFGSSGLLAKQIAAGAPFQVFFSADEDLILSLAKSGYSRDEGALYALGPVSLFANESSELSVDADLEGLRAALAAGRIKRFSIPNPEHAPYGRVAVSALSKAVLHDTIKPYLVLGENASQALQFATLAGADGAILPSALVEAEEAGLKGRHARISQSLVSPLRQRMAAMKSAPPAALALFEFVKTPQAVAILQKYGFSQPAAP